MAFSSTIFLFAFLPAALTLYFILPFQRWRSIILLAASLVFYAWGEPVYVLLLAGSILANWLIGMRIQWALNRQKQGRARVWMWAAVIANLLPLLYFKYAVFFANSINALFGPVFHLAKLPLPLGISFFTFSAISYILDIYNQITEAQRNLIAVGNYLAMFPKLLQGPIARYQQLNPANFHFKPTLAEVAQGARRFVVGLAMKLIIADNMAVVANAVFKTEPSMLGANMAWYGLIAYALQIYFDFAGYTSMAIGLGAVLGFKLPENFNYPYISRSITDFWRRWHMTLTAWFRNYVFLPLEYARRRSKRLRQQTNLVIVFLLTGLWHGASWNFVLWGVYFGLILAVEASGLAKQLKKLPAVLQHLYALLLILFGWVFFRVTDIAQWGPFFKALFGGNGLSGLENARTLNVLLFWPLMVVALVGCTPVIPWVQKKLNDRPAARVFGDVLVVSLLLLSIVFLVSNGYNAFIYFQF